MKNPRPLVNHMYTLYIVHTSMDEDLFKSVYREATVALPGDHLHNNNINYYDHSKDENEKRPRNKTQIYYPSRLYEFRDLKESMECNFEHPTNTNMDLPECIISIKAPAFMTTKKSLAVCQRISTHQAVTDLRMFDVECRYRPHQDVPVITLRNPQSVSLINCHLPESFVRNIFHQLSGAGDTLKWLQLHEMYLKPFEPDLDQLLDAFLSHHQRMNSSSQKELNIRLPGVYLMRTNFSKRSVGEWYSRCKKSHNIHLFIYPESDFHYCDLGDYMKFCRLHICGCCLLCY